MARFSRTIHHLGQCAVILCTLLLDATRFLRLCLRAPAAVAAENLFLRKQLALYQERHIPPRRASNPTRFTLVWLSQWFDWRPALVGVQPATFQQWRRQRCKLFWHWTSGPGRPPLPGALHALIRQMPRDNLTWGQRRIANELRLKLGLQVSPRTVRKYMPTRRDWTPGCRVLSQRWRTFLRNHAWDLIVSGIAVDLTRGRQAWSARLMQGLQCGWGHAVASREKECSQRATAPMALLSETILVPATWSVDTGQGICVAERSPPAMVPPHNHDACTATRATQMDMPVVSPVMAALARWERAGPHSRGIQSLHHGVTRATPWQRVA
jgi:hypothetical protein